MKLPEVVIPSVMEITPYIPGTSKVKGRDNIIKLSSNENPFGPGSKAVAALRKAAAKAHRYPDGGSYELCAAIAAQHDIPAQNIVCGAGSDELIALLCQAYAGVGGEVLYSEHGFLMYPISALRGGAKPVAAKEKGLRADVNNLLKAVTKKTRIVFIANPNNPTGSYLTREELTDFRSKLRSDILLVVDAAYAEYVEKNDYTAGQELVESTHNTVMLRTFSKIYGLASLRLGWAYAPDAVVDILHRVRGPFNVSGIGQVAGVAAMADQAFVNKSRAHNSQELARVTKELSALGLKVYPSVANFVLVEFSAAKGKAAADVDAYLKECGIIGRRMEAYKLPKCMRFSIGLKKEDSALLGALKAFLK